MMLVIFWLLKWNSCSDEQANTSEEFDTSKLLRKLKSIPQLF